MISYLASCQSASSNYVPPSLNLNVTEQEFDSLLNNTQQQTALIDTLYCRAKTKLEPLLPGVPTITTHELQAYTRQTLEAAIAHRLQVQTLRQEDNTGNLTLQQLGEIYLSGKINPILRASVQSSNDQLDRIQVISQLPTYCDQLYYMAEDMVQLGKDETPATLIESSF